MEVMVVQTLCRLFAQIDGDQLIRRIEDHDLGGSVGHLRCYDLRCYGCMVVPVGATPCLDPSLPRLAK